MKPRNLLVAAVLLVALSGAVWWSKRHPEAGKPKTDTQATPKVLDVPAAQIQSLTIQKKGGSAVTVEHRSGKWQITKPEELPTDQDAVNALTSALSGVNADSVVEDKPADLGKYGLTSPSLTVAIQETGGKSDTLVFGDDVPAGSTVYARVNSDPKVYALYSSVKSSLDKTANDLRDKRLLTIDTNTVTSIDVTSPKGTVAFAKNNANDWQIVKPQPFRAENFQVEELLRKLTEAKMDLSGNADDAKKADAAFASGQKVGTAKITAGAGTQTLEVRKVKDDYYARSSAVKGAYKISSDLGKQMEKSAEDYRNKKLFDFGFSDPTKITLGGSLGDKTLTRSGTDWKMGAQTMDPGSVQAFLDKIRDLTASKFATSGFTTPAFSIAVTSNDGKRNEKTEFAKFGDGYLARRENEPALYQFDAKSVEDAVNAAKAIKPAAQGKK
jgi:hypothetical protein